MLFSRRSRLAIAAKQKLRNRRVLLEKLDPRQLLAGDVAVGPSPISPPHDQVSINALPSSHSLSFSAAQASKVELGYGNAYSDEAVYLDYGPQSVELSNNVLMQRSDLEIVADNPSMFTASPYVAGGQLRFRLTGKPSYVGVSEILVRNFKTGVLLSTIKVEIDNSVENASEFTSAVDDSSRDRFWSVFAEGMSMSSSGVGSLTLAQGDNSAEEPHTLYSDSTDSIASIKIDRDNWPGGPVDLKVAGTAKHGTDYVFGAGSAGSSSWIPNGNGEFELDVPPGTGAIYFYVYAVNDSAEPGQLDSNGDADGATETVTFDWVDPNDPVLQGGQQSINIQDMAETISIVAMPSTISELDDTPAEYSVTPGNSGFTFKTDLGLHWEVRVPGQSEAGIAQMGDDYSVDDDYNGTPLVFLPADAENVRQTQFLRRAESDNEFVLSVIASNDGELEGPEEIKVRAYVPALIPAGDSTDDSRARTDFASVTITEEYLDAQVEKDEDAGCSCTCTTCSDGNGIKLNANDGSAEIVTAEGLVIVSTGGQNGEKPVTYAGVTLPSGKAVPETISAKLQVVQKWDDSNGSPVGLGRELAGPNAVVSPAAKFDLPTSATAGQTYWFALQADLADWVESWTRDTNGEPADGTNGTNATIVPLELLVTPTFSTAVTQAAQKFSGWVGRVSHVLIDEDSSSISSGIGGNVAYAGVERMIRDTEILVPDAPAGGGSTGGKVKFESGSMLVRANGGLAWYENSSGQSPATQDTLAGDYLTDRHGNKRKFNSDGEQTELTDAAGNTTGFAYDAVGRLTEIEDQRGQKTTFAYNTAGSEVTVTTQNQGTGNDSILRLNWSPISVNGGSFKVDYEDPDGSGAANPRKARQDVFNYNNAGFLTSIQSGEIGAPTHTTTFNHDVSFSNSGVWLTPISGSQRLASVTYPDGSSTTIDVARQQNGLVDLFYSGSTISAGDSRALRLAPGGFNSTPDYAVLTHNRVGSADPQRSIMQLDHRGRVIRSWDSEQVHAVGLATGLIDENDYPTLQANIALSHEYSRESTQRDDFGRITGEDYGEVLTYTSPLPGTGGPRQTTSWSYTNNNPDTQTLPVQSQESFTWNDTYDVLTQAVDATGNAYHQVIDGSGRVTEQRWEQQGESPTWQNPVLPEDVNNDGSVSPIDALIIINLINGGGGGPVANLPGAPPNFYDVNGDDFVSPIDTLIVANFLNGGSGIAPSGSPPQVIGKVNNFYSVPSGLPTTLVSSQTINTGRSSGDTVINYEYHNTPANRTLHGKLKKVIETAGGVAAETEFEYDERGNLSKITNPEGLVQEMWYDNRDRLIARLSPSPGDGALPVLQRFDYDVFDNLIATEVVNSWKEGPTVYATSLVTRMTYDAGNRVASETTTDHRKKWYLTGSGSTVLRGSAANPTTPPVAPSLAQLKYYASENSPVAAIAPTDRGTVTTYSYFATTNQVGVSATDYTTSPTSTRTATSTLDRLNRTTNSTLPESYSQSYAYDNLGNLTSTTDPRGNTTSFVYDSLNRITQLKEPAPSGSGTVDTSFSYAEKLLGWEVTTTLPSTPSNSAGQTITSQLDMLGRTVEVSGDTPSVSFQYWEDGRVKSVTDELGRVTDYDYDTRGRLTSVLAPAPSTGVARSETQYQYRKDNLLSKVIDPLLRETTYSYDVGGRLSTMTAPDPDGIGGQAASFTTYTRDAIGNVLSSSDAISPASVYSYDAWFRGIKQQDPSGAVTQTELNGFGETTKVTDASANVTRFEYDALGQLRFDRKDYAGATKSRQYQYDDAGNLVTFTDRDGDSTTYLYDNQNRRTHEKWNGQTTYTYVYDAADRLTSIIDANSDGIDFDFAYNTSGFLVGEKQYGNSLLGNKPILFGRSFDAVGNKTGLLANFNGSMSSSGVISGGKSDFENVYGYDGMNRLDTITQQTNGGHNVAPKLAAYAYDAASQRTDLRRYSDTSPSTLDVHSRYGYDDAGRLTSITHAKAEIASGQTWNGTSSVPVASSNMLAAYNLSYDQDNRITSLSSWTDGFKTTFGYDTRDQLTSATTSQISGIAMPYLLGVESYGFDATGNRNTAGSNTPALSHNQQEKDGTYEYQYDDEGNVLLRSKVGSWQATEYEWDQRNRLVSVANRSHYYYPTNYTSGGSTQPGVYAHYATHKVEYTYDAFDQRVGRKEDTYVYDGSETWNNYELYVWADGQEVYRFVDSDGAGSAEPKLANRYLWGAAVDDLLADEQFSSGPTLGQTSDSAQGNTLWGLTDHLGSVRDLVGNNGVIREHVVYDSFGNRIHEVDYDASGAIISSTSAAAVDTLFGYTGRDWDADVGLQYNRARWYDPAQGRWLSQDPIGFNAGDANLYRYVGNGPVDATDPSGLVIETVGPIDEFTEEYVDADGNILIDPKKSRQDYVTALIIKRMKESDTTFVLCGKTADENIENLKAHIEARLRILKNIWLKRFRFRGDKNVFNHTNPNPPNYKENPQDYLESVNNPGTAMGCLVGTQLCVYGAIGHWDDDLLAYRPIVDEDDLIPGDWAYLFNDAFDARTWQPGLEGENLIYEGYLGFWGHFGAGNTYFSLDKWRDDIESWNGGLGKPRLRKSVAYPLEGVCDVKSP